MRLRSLSIPSTLFLLSLSACVAHRPYVDPRAAAQIAITKKDPPGECRLLGPVKGQALTGDLADAHGDLARRAVLGGGNYVAVDLVERTLITDAFGYVVRGRLYACPKEERPAAEQARVETSQAAAASETITLPKALCEPECSPGFTCLHGACVSACNPACAENEVCGGDRMCHRR